MTGFEIVMLFLILIFVIILFVMAYEERYT